MKTIAVTGGIGSGKSVVCSLLASRGFPVYDSDSRTKSLYDTDPALLGSVVTAMRPFVQETGLLTKDGRIDRKALAAVIFSDEKALAALEAVVHPAVFRDFIAWRDCAQGKDGFVVMESAIILEKPVFRDVIDVVILVDAPLELRRQRAAARDGVPEDVLCARMERQQLMNRFSTGEARVSAGYVLTNDAGLEELSDRLDDILKKILKTCKT